MSSIEKEKQRLLKEKNNLNNDIFNKLPTLKQLKLLYIYNSYGVIIPQRVLISKRRLIKYFKIVKINFLENTDKPIFKRKIKKISSD